MEPAPWPAALRELSLPEADLTALPVIEHSPRWVLAGVLLVVSFLTTTTLGAVWFLWTRVEITTQLQPFLSPRTVIEVWSDPWLLRQGMEFAGAALFILFCHEMGHYLTCRWYRLPATLPYFLPAPLALGTFGAFIRIRAPIRSKRQLFDVGVGGPLAGFVALVPFLIVGVARSRPMPIDAPLAHDAVMTLFLPGRSLAMELLTRAFHGPLPPGTVLEPHPLALAAWFGLLATALNLLPLGQLDGGHILYAATGGLQRRLALPLWLALGLMALIWPGWILWSLIVLVMGLPHPPVRDERTPLDPVRRGLAWATLVVFILCFIPEPVIQMDVAARVVPDRPEAGQLATASASEPGADDRSDRAFREPPQTSRIRVTGPSLTSSTRMWAPKRPVSTR